MTEYDSQLVVVTVLAGLVGSLLGAAALWWAQRHELAVDDRLFHLLVGIYVVLALVVAWVLRVTPTEFVDGYYDRALNLLRFGVYGQGDQPTAFFPPGYSFLLYVAMLVLGEGIRTVFLLNISLFVATLYLLRYSLKVVGIRHYNAFSLVLLVAGGRFFFHFFPVSDAIGSYLFLSALLLVVLAIRAERPQFLLLLTSGILLGIDVLARANAILLVIPLLLIVFVSSKVLASRTLMAVLILVGLTVPVGLWTWRNYEVFHEVFFVSTNGGYNMFLGNGETATGLWDSDPLMTFPDTAERIQIQQDTEALTDVQRDHLLGQEAASWIRQHPVDFLRLAAKKLVRAFASDTGALGILRTEIAFGRVAPVPDWLLAGLYFLANIVYFALLVVFASRLVNLLRQGARHALELGVTMLLVGCVAAPIAATFGLSRFRDLFFYLMLVSVAGLLQRVLPRHPVDAPARLAFVRADSMRGWLA